MSVLQVMGVEGDLRVEWDPDNAVQVDAAKAAFDKAKAQRMVAYGLGEDGQPGEVLSRFDPKAGRIVMRPPMQGG